ncbi:uncharacterized protein LOC109796527 [Cajanus cajan]|uniref:uncharacterized protein LOC109796527 n=1 Tax=Cajanus cajan TaxID=3821 RepID=UPI00098DC785|nr:uncharacterized protein LOC109796527 [Cajanus cajan]
MDELRARTAGYIQMEEHAEFRNSIRDSFTTKGESSTRESSKAHIDQRSKRPRQSRGPRYEFYTPLNAPRVNILEEANHADLISLPPSAHNPVNADKSKHCRYHRNHGHTTNECWSLKDQIEELIQAGQLGQYIQRGQTSRGGFRGRGRGRGRFPGRYQGRYQNYQGRSEQSHFHQTNTREESKPSTNSADPQHMDKSSEGNNIRGVIHTIPGGFAGGGSSNSARKRHLRIVQNVNNLHNSGSKSETPTPPIIFTDDDYEGISLNQDDPMVISVEVANWEVQKMLKLDIPHIQNSRRILVKYLLVDAATSYNILIGRPTLNQLGAVVSTPHLTMKFPDTDGHIIAVKANQKIVRKCYAESLKITPLNRQPEVSASPVIAHIGTREMADLDPRIDMHDHQPDPIDELIEFQIGKKPNQCTKIDKHIEPQSRIPLRK